MMKDVPRQRNAKDNFDVREAKQKTEQCDFTEYFNIFVPYIFHRGYQCHLKNIKNAVVR